MYQKKKEYNGGNLKIYPLRTKKNSRSETSSIERKRFPTSCSKLPEVAHCAFSIRYFLVVTFSIQDRARHCFKNVNLDLNCAPNFLSLSLPLKFVSKNIWNASLAIYFPPMIRVERKKKF